MVIALDVNHDNGGALYMSEKKMGARMFPIIFWDAVS